MTGMYLPLQLRGLLILSKNLSDLTAPSTRWQLTQFASGKIGLVSSDGIKVPAAPAPQQWPPASQSIAIIEIFLGALLDENQGPARQFIVSALKRVLYFENVELQKWIQHTYKMSDEDVGKVMDLIKGIFRKVCSVI
jgi:hypothetical protein